MNLQQILDYLTYMSQKHGTGGTLTNAQYNNLLQTHSLGYWVDNYNPKIDTKGGFETNYEFIDSTARFKVPVILSINPFGQAAIPSNYCHYSDLQYSFTDYDQNNQPFTNYKTLSLLTNTEYNSLQVHSYKNPTVKNPICKRVQGYFQFAPFNIGSYGIMNLTYLKLPNVPFYAAIFVSDAWVYDPVNSIQLDYEVIDIEKIKYRMLRDIGINLQDADLAKYADEYQMQLKNTSK